MSAPASRRRIAVLLSGGGRTLMNLADHMDRGALDAEIALVIASHHCPGADRAAARRLPTLVVPGVIPEATLARILRDHSVEYVALAGYLKLLHIPPEYQWRVVNIHPALLPAFGGAGMYGRRVHEAVIEAGCKVSGATVHFCDEAYDRGPIIAQRACEVRDDDTPESLGERVFQLECELYPQVLQALTQGRISIDGRRARIIPG